MFTRGRRTVASALAEALALRSEARLPATAAAFAEACGWRLCQQAAMRGLTASGRLIVVARTPEWATQLHSLSDAICAKINVRLGRVVATGLDVRVGPLLPEQTG
jgi:hypothetical protein